MLKQGHSRREEAQREPVRRWRIVATVAGVRSEPSQVQECEVFKWRCRYKKKVIHGDSHQHENVPQSQERRSPAKNCDIRVR